MTNAEQKAAKFGKDWRFTFGKYGPISKDGGHTLEEVAKMNLEYISWCIDNIAWFRRLLLAAKDDPWMKKLIWCIKTERHNYEEGLQAWAWGLCRYPHFGDRTTKILYDGRTDDLDDEKEDELTAGDFGFQEGGTVGD